MLFIWKHEQIRSLMNSLRWDAKSLFMYIWMVGNEADPVVAGLGGGPDLRRLLKNGPQRWIVSLRDGRVRVGPEPAASGAQNLAS